jgi:hypothetical protein
VAVEVMVLLFAQRTKAEKEEIREEREQVWEEEGRKENEEAEREEEEHRQSWNAEVRFTPEIRKVKGKHLDPDSSEMKFNVWCSDGYDPDGWHGYDGEPPKEFDSAWKTKEDANSRAEYLFYWKNAWGYDPEELNDNNEVVSKNTGNLKEWTVSPADSTRWTVAAVPSDAFLYLSNACKDSHNLDDERDEERNEESCRAPGNYFGSYFYFRWTIPL